MREFNDLLAEIAVTGGPNVIRHTVRTWLAEAGVPEAAADVFIGQQGGKAVRHGSAISTAARNIAK